MKKKIYIFLIVIIILVVAVLSFILIANHHVVSTANNYIFGQRDLPDAEYAVVLGAKAYEDDTPSPVLKNRLDKALELFEIGRVKRLLLTGYEAPDPESGREITTMENYVSEHGVDKVYIELDPKGVNTVSSMKNLAAINEQDPRIVIIITQEFHIHRAVFIARSLGIEAYGAIAEDPRDLNISYLGFRELMARAKDFILMLFE